MTDNFENNFKHDIYPYFSGQTEIKQLLYWSLPLTLTLLTWRCQPPLHPKLQPAFHWSLWTEMINIPIGSTLLPFSFAAKLKGSLVPVRNYHQSKTVSNVQILTKICHTQHTRNMGCTSLFLSPTTFFCLLYWSSGETNWEKEREMWAGWQITY